ncbi:phage tail protein I [Alkalilimnicola ehrlichii]|uniref:Phage tail protein I n=1 Tax=Alkalilimnicola ehrlichii TaxID=351052 RepID=A0A3E0X4D1_9GAMM|nr:phage tail protein I [Alkalilimnicola ehrlichii]RFA31330.1 phage tail protein I [Alkalilimnicola ehrlichii]RFA39396.1 phage tail protein I [Alkalilimnicola ehrlichii]
MTTSLLPPNATRLERALEASDAQLSELDLAKVDSLWNPDRCPASLLPWLAWAVGVEGWNSNWTTARQRRVIKTALETRRYRGTLGSLRRELAALGMDILVREWWEIGDTPHHYELDIELTDSAIPDDLHLYIHDVVGRYARESQVLDVVNLYQPVCGATYVGAAITLGDDLCVYPPAE